MTQTARGYATLINVAPDLLTTSAAAKELGISTRTLQQWTRDGVVTPTFTTAGGHYRWDLEDLKGQLAERKAGQGEPQEP